MVETSVPTSGIHYARIMDAFPGRPASSVSEARAAVRVRQETDSHRVFMRDVLLNAKPRDGRSDSAHQSATEDITGDADPGLGRLGRRPM